MVRMFHLLLWVQHALWAYVDDFFLVQPSSVIELGSSLLLCFCAVFGVPISYAKLQLGSVIRWIGWQFNIISGHKSLASPRRNSTSFLPSV